MYSHRPYARLSKEYRIEYGPYSALFSNYNLKPATVKNVSGSGVLFRADEHLQVGSKIFLTIHVSGWKQDNGSCLPVADQASVLLINAIAEVVRVEHDPESGIFRTGARFVGRVH